MRRRPITPTLVAYGWHRDDSPAEVVGECGAETEISVCGKPARWRRSSPLRGPLCAQHALMAQRSLDYFPGPTLPERTT